MQQQMAQPQIQNGGCVPVWAEQEARNYPVARGVSVTFRDETAPYIYTKSMGFGQQDRPIFEIYKKVDDPQEEPKNVLDDVKAEISTLWGEINALKEQPKKPYVNRKKEDGGD
jgi:hypothetical protein